MPPGKFVKLDSLKCNFLRSLNGNWSTGKVFKALKNAHICSMIKGQGQLSANLSGQLL